MTSPQRLPQSLPSVRSAGNQPGALGALSPAGKTVKDLRQAMLDAVTEDDVREAIQRLAWEAKGGNIQAARELLLRVLGPAEAVDLQERIEALEAVARDVSEDQIR